MKRTIIFYLTIGWGSVLSQDVIGDRKNLDGLEYLVTTPDNYNKNQKAGYPLLLFLHGGDRSNTKHHPKKYAERASVNFPFIVVAPHCTGGCSWSGVDFEALLKKVQQEYNVDTKRMYITGYSMGGYGTWSALEKYALLFAAAAPIAGGGNASKICVANNLPIKAYHGDKDNVIDYSQSKKMIDALKKCNGKAELVTIKDGNHGIWPSIFQSDNFYSWLLEHHRP